MGVKFPHPAKNKERLKTARDGTKARNSDPLVSLPVQIQKRQQENGPQSTTKSPTPDTKRLKTDPNGSKIKKVPFHPSPSGRGAGGEVVSLPWAEEVCDQWERAVNDQQDPPQPHAVVGKMAAAGFFLSTYITLHHYVKRIREEGKFPDPVK